MKSYKKVFLRLNSNSKKYKVEILGCSEYLCKTIHQQREFLCFYTASPSFIIIISPLENSYNSKLYYKFHIEQRNFFEINFNFLKIIPPTIQQRVYTFYLTDLNYGLKINGELNFNSK